MNAAQPETAARGPEEPGPDDAPQQVSTAILTVPNLITFVRILLIPVFLWLLLIGRDFAAAGLMIFVASTDFIDGRVARRYNQVSELGTMLDPVADRILILAAAVGVIVRGDIMPLWLIIILIVREVITASWTVYLKGRGIQLKVIFIGKCQASMVFACIPAFILAAGFADPFWGPPGGAAQVTHDVLLILGYVFGIGGACLGFITTGFYLKSGIEELHATREPGRNTGDSDGDGDGSSGTSEAAENPDTNSQLAQEAR